MVTLREALEDAVDRKVALGHFNAPTVSMIRAIVAGAQMEGCPVIIGFSEGERDFFGVRQAISYIRSLSEETGQAIFINADHTYSVDRVKEAIDAGFDSVIFDGAKLSFDDNVRATKECVAYARASGRDVLVEGELGFIGSGSQILEEVPEGAVITEANMTTLEDAKRFVEETGVDLFAPAVGNIHGMLRGGKNPHINIVRVKEISEAAGVPLVLHGGSGISDDDVEKGIKAGISEVHISTELRLAYRHSLEDSLSKNKDEIAPYKLMAPVVEVVQKVVEEKLALFNRP